MKIKYELTEDDIKNAIAAHVARVHNTECIAANVTITISPRYDDRSNSSYGHDIKAEAS